MPETITAPSDLEIKNSIRVMDLLRKIKEVSFEQQENHPDIFVVNEDDTGLDLIVDVEEDTVVSYIEVAEFIDNIPEGLAQRLLEINHSAVQGAFTITKGKLFFKSNLQLENLDQNELEASLHCCFLTVDNNIEEITNYLSK